MANGLAPLDATETSDGELARIVRSILNKLTPEKFSTLYGKLMQCGIANASHLEMLARLVFDEAVVQHSFSGMYAELCMYMIVDLGEYADGCALKEKMFSHCIELLECPLDQAPQCTSPRALEDEEEAQALHKKRLVGGVRFAGELILRGVFPGELLFTFTEHLLTPPLQAHNLERLATLLTTIGPVLDSPMWPLHDSLVPIFWTVNGLTFDFFIPKRIRCLLRDVIELRDACWNSATGSKQNVRPMMLDEVRRSAGEGAPDWHGPTGAEMEAMGADFDNHGNFFAWDFGGSMEMMPMFSDQVAGLPRDGSFDVPMFFGQHEQGFHTMVEVLQVLAEAPDQVPGV
mmetsp:Transcript_86597/g.279592  ORF Transcript_86597/g.279592 Transcript_86597/m.279592 type:complete len:345 (+) Transcript_86597:1727-2761(+)